MTSSSNKEDKSSERAEASKLLSTRLQNASVALVKAANALPRVGAGHELYSTYALYAQRNKAQRTQITAAMKKLLTNSGCKVKLPADGPQDMDRIIFANDLLIERTSMALDEHQKRLVQSHVGTRELRGGAEVVPGAAKAIRAKAISLNDSMATVQGFQDGLGRYAQLGRNTKGSRNGSKATQAPSLDPQSLEKKDMPVQSKESPFNAEGYLDLLLPGSNFNVRQHAALEKLWKWRWVTAQRSSKSISTVLPDHMLLHLAEVLPKEMQGIIAICHPLPPLVQHDLPLLHRIISTARELKLEGGKECVEAAAADQPQAPAFGSAKLMPRPTLEEQLRLIAWGKKSISSIASLRARAAPFELSQSLVGRSQLSAASVTLTEKYSKSEVKRREAQLRKVNEVLSRWTTPYESYLLAVREANTEPST